MRRVLVGVVGAVALLALALACVRVANLWWLGRIGWYSGEILEVAADPSSAWTKGWVIRRRGPPSGR